ncbi:flavin reductase [Streptomyces sp. RLB3-17]|uniref:flavin reductase n=1 Tax=Streptomyces sp. RLB3-17 TaxID=2594455 RepID=UPI001CECD536|nr:flavin reductase [Streptomyces sp. RLB3-17]
MADVIDALRPSAAMPVTERIRLRVELSTAARECREAMELLLDLHGASGFADDNPLQRFWRDVAVGTRHPAPGTRHPYFTCGPAPGCPRRADGCLSGPSRRSTTGIDRFDHPAIGHDDGLTSVAGAVAWLECRMVDRVPAGDHHIVLAARVRGGHGGRDQSRLLLYRDRRYTSVTEPKEDEAVKKPARRQRGAQERGSVSI